MCPATATITVTAVSITYTDEDNQTHVLNIDTSRAQAIAWTDDHIEARAADPDHGAFSIPLRERDEQNHTRARGFCWWDGQTWRCC